MYLLRLGGGLGIGVWRVGQLFGHRWVRYMNVGPAMVCMEVCG